jgi:hypothetical protein
MNPWPRKPHAPKNGDRDEYPGPEQPLYDWAGALHRWLLRQRKLIEPELGRPPRRDPDRSGDNRS